MKVETATQSQYPEGAMLSTVEVGTILMKEWPGMPRLLGLESEPSSGEWGRLKVLDGFALDRKIHAAGWNFFFMATGVKAIFLGKAGATKIQNALKRILGKVKQEHFNCLEVTAIVARRFLGVPYVTLFRALPTFAAELLAGRLGGKADDPAQSGMGPS